MLQTLPGWVSWPLTFVITARAMMWLVRLLRRMDTRTATTVVPYRRPAGVVVDIVESSDGIYRAG